MSESFAIKGLRLYNERDDELEMETNGGIRLINAPCISCTLPLNRSQPPNEQIHFVDNDREGAFRLFPSNNEPKFGAHCCN